MASTVAAIIASFCAVTLPSAGDFEKGEADGAKATLAVVAAAVCGWRG
jgi:hypothetical protein